MPPRHPSETRCRDTSSAPEDSSTVSTGADSLPATVLAGTRTLPSPPENAAADVAAAEARQWRPGDRVAGLYEVEAELGQGATAVVYRVLHLGWNTRLAVKTPRPGTLRSSSALEHFEREAQTWVNLGLHPHVASCYYVRRLGGVPRLFAEYVEGGDLAGMIRSGTLYCGPAGQGLRRVLDIAVQCAWGLAHAHEHNLVHQDVKPANVLLTTRGIAKVTDFGLARAHSGPDKTVACCGMTPAYCSPEQAAHLDQGQCDADSGTLLELNRATDVWSWAVMVLEMFTGGACWERGSEADAALERLCRDCFGKESLPPMPAGVTAILRQCLARDVRERPDDMGAIAARLEHLYAEATGEPYPRQQPSRVVALADSLNNRAVSLLDLHEHRQALACWDQALQHDPCHAESRYNQGLVLWRSGRLDDARLVSALQDLHQAGGGGWCSRYYLGLVRLERGEYAHAQVDLEAARGASHGRGEIGGALDAARAGAAQGRQLLCSLSGHTSAVHAVAVSVDGRRAVSGSGSRFAFGGSSDISVRVWDLDAKQCQHVLQGHSARVTGVAISADGSKVLSGSADTSLMLWDAARGSCVAVLEGHTAAVRSVAMSGRGHLGLSGDADGVVKLWDLEAPRCVCTMAGHGGAVHAVALSADGCIGLTGGDDGVVRVWDTAAGQCRRECLGHDTAVHAVALSADGRIGFTGGDDGVVRVWDTAAGQCRRECLGHAEAVLCVCLSADGRHGFSGGGDELGHERAVRLWELQTGRCLHTLEGHRGCVRGMCLSGDGSCALSAGDDMRIQVWRPGLAVPGFRAPLMLSRLHGSQETLEVQQAFGNCMRTARTACAGGDVGAAVRAVHRARALPGFNRNLEAVALWSDLYVRAPRGRLQSAWNTARAQCPGSGACALVLAPGGTCVCAGDDGNIRVWDTKAHGWSSAIAAHDGSVLALDWQDPCVQLLSAGADGRIRLWDVQTGTCVREFRGHNQSVAAARFSWDNRLLVSAGADATVRLWETATGHCVGVLRGHAAGVAAVCFSTHRRWVLSGSDDHTIRRWDVQSGRCACVFEGRDAPVRALDLSWDATRALSGEPDGCLRLWDPETGVCLRAVHGHPGGVTAVRMSLDGRLGISGGRDGAVRLWDLETGQCLRLFKGHGCAVAAVAMSPDARLVASAGCDGSLMTWFLDWDLQGKAPGEGALEPLLHMGACVAATACPEPDLEALERFRHVLACCGFGNIPSAVLRTQVRDMSAATLRPSAPHLPVCRDGEDLTGPSTPGRRSSLMLDWD